MRPEDIQKELDKFRNGTPVEPGCKLHGGFKPFRFEIFAPPVGTWRMGDIAPNCDIRLDGDNVVVTTFGEREWTEPSSGRRKAEVIEVHTFSCEKVEYAVVTYAKENQQ